jgi:DNA-binding response OmpR family regulator
MDAPQAPGGDTPHAKLVLVEDDPELASLVREFLQGAGFDVTVEGRGDRAVEVVRAADPDLVILDVMLPGRSGIEVCRELRRDSPVAILMLTALGDDVDEIVGLEVGADDYLVKPLRPRLLLARVRALLRRSQADASRSQPPPSLQTGPLRIERAARRVLVGGEEVALTTAEFDLLALLAERCGEVVGRDELYQELRGLDYDGLDRSIDLRVSRVRAKLGDAADLLKSVRSVGYLLVEETPKPGGEA